MKFQLCFMLAIVLCISANTYAKKSNRVNLLSQAVSARMNAAQNPNSVQMDSNSPVFVPITRQMPTVMDMPKQFNSNNVQGNQFTTNQGVNQMNNQMATQMGGQFGTIKNNNQMGTVNSQIPNQMQQTNQMQQPNQMVSSFKPQQTNQMINSQMISPMIPNNQIRSMTTNNGVNQMGTQMNNGQMGTQMNNGQMGLNQMNNQINSQNSQFGSMNQQNMINNIPTQFQQQQQQQQNMPNQMINNQIPPVNSQIINQTSSFSSTMDPCVSSQPGDIIANPASPHQFIICYGFGEFTIMDCPEHLVYNQHLVRCDLDNTIPPGCSSNPCMNNGKCVDLPQLFTFRCECPSGFTGQTCEKMDSCASKPCGPDGVCISMAVGSPVPNVCLCNSGRTVGTSCNQQNVEMNPCFQPNSNLKQFPSRVSPSVFIHCEGTRPHFVFCQFPLVYSPSRQICDWTSQ